MKVYAAVKAAGVRTYATKDPVGADAADYAPYLDIWCSQPYSVPYERIVAQKRYEYWCYPNHNAGEIKDRLTMCKGGRMTYGFGFWRSGYTTLIPWHWCWTVRAGPVRLPPRPVLRVRAAGGRRRRGHPGGLLGLLPRGLRRRALPLHAPAGDRPARRTRSDPACQAAVREGRRLLQETWDAIRVQPKYLADGHVAVGGVRRRPVAPGGPDRRTAPLPRHQQGDSPIGLDRLVP